MKKLKTIICVCAASMLATSANAFAYEYPSWSAKDENGNAIMSVQNEDGTWVELPSWIEAYAALDYDSAPDNVKEMILVARRCLTLEKMGINPHELYAEYLGAEFNPDLQ